MRGGDCPQVIIILEFIIMDVDLHWRFAVCLSNGVHRGISADKGIVLLLPKTIDIHVFF